MSTISEVVQLPKALENYGNQWHRALSQSPAAVPELQQVFDWCTAVQHQSPAAVPELQQVFDWCTAVQHQSPAAVPGPQQVTAAMDQSKSKIFSHAKTTWLRVDEEARRTLKTYGHAKITKWVGKNLNGIIYGKQSRITVLDARIINSKVSVPVFKITTENVVKMSSRSGFDVHRIVNEADNESIFEKTRESETVIKPKGTKRPLTVSPEDHASLRSKKQRTDVNASPFSHQGPSSLAMPPLGNESATMTTRMRSQRDRFSMHKQQCPWYLSIHPNRL